MITTSISNIKSSLATLQENLPNFRKYLKENYTDTMNTGQWGSEKEYSPNGLLGGIQNIITDLTSLVENPATFIRLSTYEDRQNIHQYLSHLSQETNRCDLSTIALRLDHLKKILHPYNLRTDKQRMIVYQQKIDELTQQAEHLTQVLEEAREQGKDINEIYSFVSEKAEEISNKEKAITTSLEQSKAIEEQLDTLKEDLVTVAKEIRALNSTSSSLKDETIAYRDDVKKFAEEISEHQRKIEKQNAQFEVFKETLDKNTTEQSNYLKEARKLIEESRLALNYTTSVGLSASFDAQCKYLTGKWGYKLWGWLVASVVSILGIIAIGIWLITTEHSQGNRDYSLIWIQIFGKLSMIPLLVTATIFCANQYTKQKVLLEDYSYKLRLAQSMVDFSEELREKDSEKYKEYLSNVLKEILKDPLRIRIDPNKSSTTKSDVLISKDSLPLLEKLISLVQQATHIS
ncbi:MAG: hypothetical protein D8H91_10455 [Alloprevotella sp.]|nr:MAG: hypothetical protein D8H91_10455 [Alloprevotella sp.]